MPEVHDLDQLLLAHNTIVDVIRSAQEPSNIRTLPVWRSKLWKIRQRLRAVYQVITESDRCLRIVLRDEANDLLDFFEGLRSENYFPSHPRIFSRTRSRGMPSPESSSAAALSRRASSAASSASDMIGSCLDWSHAASADFSLVGNFSIASWISVIVLISILRLLTQEVRVGEGAVGPSRTCIARETRARQASNCARTRGSTESESPASPLGCVTAPYQGESENGGWRIAKRIVATAGRHRQHARARALPSIQSRRTRNNAKKYDTSHDRCSSFSHVRQKKSHCRRYPYSIGPNRVRIITVTLIKMKEDFRKFYD